MGTQGMDRRGAMAALALAGVGTAVGAPAAVGAVGAVGAGQDEDWPTTAQQALRRLLRGNARFAAGRARHRGQDVDAVHETAGGQHPYVIMLGCSDSRVPPEIVFDEGVGAVFDQRVAGGIVGPAVLGSIEFAVGEFAPPLLVVLGHERCGAVAATAEVVEHGGHAPEHVQTIVDAIRPAVLAVRDEPGDLVENAVRENTRLVARRLVRRSGIIREAVQGGRLEVLAARYDLDTGRVRLL
ncbi:carbonic anhydrase [Vallicoccus soli]|uniref:carbonic anhydrase n=1 Tax=Vallicoccus soli TaxID=2339232 RepID=A0A3A3Z1C9_9ACTN|nr:carbonic anhydrase [Vallicoccus soli]RJK95298.1 carbonic anhydrase [Vallicoccus soli]